MTPLTVQQRLEAYRWALENFRTHDDSPYICRVLEDWYDSEIEYSCLTETELFELFPEFGSKKPVIISEEEEPWFDDDEPGNAQREALLRECIAECEGMLEKEITQLT